MRSKIRKHNHIAKVLLTPEQIQKRVQQLARQISKDYATTDLTLVSVLKGSIIFFADLLRLLKINCAVDFIAVSSYADTASSGVVRLVSDLRENPAGKHLLLVEDIVDSGRTLQYLKANLLTRKPASVRTCVLLDKQSSRKTPVTVDYRGFKIPDAYVVGYGLDHNEEFRGLPYIGVLKK